MKIDTVIIDEAQKIKNSRARRTKAVKTLCKDKTHIIGLSGTFIENRPAEFFNILNIISPASFPSFWEYGKRYCNLHHNGFGWDFSGSSHTEELHTRLSTVMLRRLKKDVLKDLPEKVKTIVPLELSNAEEYRRAEGDFFAWLNNIDPEKAASAMRAEALAKIEYLKQLTIKGKIDFCIDWIKDFLEADEKLVVFCVHKSTVSKLMETFESQAEKIDGSVTGEDRQKAVDAFQNNSTIKLLVGNIKAAGVGITLTAASNVCFVELPWEPASLEQASDRVHRIGQKESVNIWYLIAQDSIEEKILSLLIEKEKIIEAVLNGKRIEEISVFEELFKITRNNLK